MTALADLFDVAYGHKLDMNKMRPADPQSGVAFVGRIRGNQGVSGYVEEVPGLQPCAPGQLTVALGGNPLASFVQQRAFYTAQNVAVLEPKDSQMPLKHRIYYAACIRHNAWRYTAFGREANRTLGTIDLPDAVPDWVANVEIPSHDGLAKPAGEAVQLPQVEAWQSFTLDELFEVKKGRRLTKASRQPGSVPFIGASEKNNGITDFNEVTPSFPGGQLTVAYNGNSVGWAFFQDKPFFACDDVNVLVPRAEMSKWELLFVAAVIKHGKDRFTYGYKWTLERMKKTAIRLPADAQGQPDWSLMRSYMRSLPFSNAVDS